MAFTIPNLGAASHDDMAFPNQADIDALTAGIGGNGVTSGCLVTPQGSPNMTVHVAAGTLSVGSSAVSVTAGDVTITAAASNPRRDLIVANLSGVLSAIAGTPVAVVPSDPTIVPVLPTLPSDRIALAAVDVPANTSTITAAEIVDKRVLLSSGVQTVSAKIVKAADENVANNTLQDDNHFFFSVGANQTWFVQLYVMLFVDSSADFQQKWTFPAGTIGHWWDLMFMAGNWFGASQTLIATTISHSVALGTDGILQVFATVTTGATAGTLQYQWAKLNNAGGDDIIRQNSVLIATRMS